MRLGGGLEPVTRDPADAGDWASGSRRKGLINCLLPDEWEFGGCLPHASATFWVCSNNASLS